MVAAHVENAVTTQEVQVRVSSRIVEVGSFGPDINPIKTGNALNVYKRRVEVTAVQFVVLALASGEQLLQIKWHGKSKKAP
jgi:hypothetical protein